MPRVGRIYVGCVIAAGGAAILQAVLDVYQNPLDWQWFILAGLTLLSGSITVKLPSIPATISVSETFVFTAVMIFGASAGTITVALDGLIISLWLQRKKREVYKALFNVAAPSLSLWCAAKVFFALSHSAPLSLAPETQIKELLGPLVAFTLAYFILNSSLIATAISLEKRTSALRVWRENFSWLSLNFFFGASVSVLLVAYLRRMGPGPIRIDFFALGVIIPLLIISYLTYKTSMGRLEDTTKHLSELNLLYISTIETLAMWIDAKDQITHGHIRRVQMLAVDLAKELGLRDPTLIKAVEAAALLHDMGKLAIPEHILNKPGRLTTGEFEKMKAHASIGAQILSSIDFPYPVVPIVRHHHENWDGSGYPDGLAGTDIPIGARILAVVDCFDALTSDRPYRPRLPTEQAIRMVTANRGRMYDPLVVDAFLTIQRSSGVKYADGHVPESPEVRQSASNKERPSNASDYRNRAFTGVEARVLLEQARQSVPVALAVFYSYEESSDEIIATESMGSGGEDLKGYRIKLGHGVSGWVAATRRPIVNSDAALDLGRAGRDSERRLQSCLSLPILAGDTLLGVLTLYSSEADRFSDAHVDLLERKGKSLLAPESDVAAGIHVTEETADAGELSFLSGGLDSQRLGIIAVRFEWLADGGARRPRFPEFLIESVRGSLRSADLLVRTPYQLVILLPHSDAAAIYVASERIRSRIRSALLSTHSSREGWRALLGIAASPQDGHSVGELLAVAESRLRDSSEGSQPIAETVH